MRVFYFIHVLDYFFLADFCVYYQFILIKIISLTIKQGLSNMHDEIKIKNSSEVDKGLVAMFLKMSPEERLKANDNAVRAIMEMRDAFKKSKDRDRS